MHISRNWIVGDYTFNEYVNHGIKSYEGKPLYKFEIDNKPGHEMYASLDEAMVAAVGEKHTGPRGAGGSGVGTAADWFMRMIGAPTAEDRPPQPSSVSVRQEFGTVEPGSTVIGYRAS